MPPLAEEGYKKVKSKTFLVIKVYVSSISAMCVGELGNRTPDLVHAKHALYQLS